MIFDIGCDFKNQEITGIWLCVHAKSHLQIIYNKQKATYTEFSFCASSFLSIDLYLVL